MHGTLWAPERPRNERHWAANDALPIAAVAAWIGAVVLTAAGLCALGIIHP